MKKRKVFASLILASAAISLAACGVNTPSTNTGSSKPTETMNTSSTREPSSTSTATSKPTSTVKPSSTTSKPTSGIASSTSTSTSVKYTVTFNPNGYGAVKVLSNVTALPQELPELVVNGYNFWGWYLDSEFKNAAIEGSEINSDVTLYAKWTKAQENAIEMNGVAYESIKKAIEAIPTSGDTSTYTISLNKGTYNENGLSYNGSATIHIVGNTRTKYGADVIIKGRGSNMTSMRGRELIEIQGTGDIILENVTLESDYSRTETTKDVQAEVLATDTKGNTVAYNCGFKSHQDTLRTAGKAWFYGCYVEGDTDFIWMEASGSVALYENCEIVSLYDDNAKTHSSYVAAPRMGITSKVGKGLVFYNSTVRESDEAKEKGQLTYLARSPWTSGYYNQVAYINTNCSDIESSIWYGKMIPTEYPQTVIGWKMDTKTAESLGLSNNNFILNDSVTASEYNGRRAILNRIYNTGKLKYEKDSLNNWDIDSLISQYGLKVSYDESKDVLADEDTSDPIIYTFDGTTDYSSLCNGFLQDNSKPHYVGTKESTITIPVTGKCYIEIYGYYAGTVEAKADTQGYSVMFFNNGSTNTEIEQDYIVYDENASEVVITAKATSYITKIVVTPDSSIPTDTKVSSIDITASTKVQTVGVSYKLSAKTNEDATNKSIVWSSSNEDIATIDHYTGKVVFKKEGNVTFTASACDGSGVVNTFECNPTEAKWTVAEWYTTDTNVEEETGATEISCFSTNNSANKSIGKEYSFENIKGETIKTKYGLKLNSAGMLSIATTKKATLTIITCDAGKVFSTPNITDGNVVLTPISAVEGTGIMTYVYEIPSAGMWDIVRGDSSAENNPILYAKCEYKEAVISSSKGITFKGSTYTESNTKISDITTPSDVIDATSTTVEIADMKLTNCASNGSTTNWLTFKSSDGAKIEFKVDKACTLLIGYYSKLQTVKFNGEIVEGNKTSVSSGAGEIVEYEITGAGVVTIEATQNDYLGFVGVFLRH